MLKNVQTTCTIALISHASKVMPKIFQARLQLGFPGGSAGKEFACNAGDLGLIPRLGRSPGEGKGYLIQYSGLETSMDYSPWGLKRVDKNERLFTFRLQQYINQELPDVQAGFRKGRGPRDQIANIQWIMEKAREFQKNIYFCFIDYAKALDCMDHIKLWKILKEMGLPDHLICLLRNLYAGQKATVRTGHGTTEWFQIGKGVCQGYMLSPCLFNFYAGYMARNARLDAGQAGIQTEI